MSNVHVSPPAADGEVRLLDIVAVLVRRWRTILFCTLAALTLAVAVHLLAEDRYVASTVLVPAANRNSSTNLRAEMMAQMPTGLAGGRGSGQELIQEIVSSRTLADSLVARMKGRADAGVVREVLSQGVDFQGTGLTGPYTITVTAPDPELAATIANEFPPVVNAIASSLAAELSLQKAQFLEEQLDSASARLAASEQQLVRFERGSDAVDLQEQAKRTVEAASRLQTAVTEQELRVRSLRRSSTPNNPALRAAQGELDGLREQLRRLTSGTGADGALYVPLSESSDLKVAAARVMRDYARDEQVYKSLTAALTQARMDASDNVPTVGVLDAAVPPGAPASRGTMMLMAIAGLAGLLVGVLAAFLAESVARMRRDPANQDFFAALEEARPASNGRNRVTAGS